ncbi:unnamed protein product [Mytilus edulis]|uniref:Uncharacterized protein n=1 Tax=Mytilus edulis TaxID=6550 RepID=A0A8S3SRJ7_MYTED|nr:unnamed protein product [Mytilus edulis]
MARGICILLLVVVAAGYPIHTTSSVVTHHSSHHSYHGVSYYKRYHGFKIRHRRFSYHGLGYKLRCGKSRFYRLWRRCYGKYHSRSRCFGVFRTRHLFGLYKGHGYGYGGGYLSYYKKYHGFKLRHNRFFYGGLGYKLRCARRRFYRSWRSCYRRYHSRSRCFGYLRKRHLFGIYHREVYAVTRNIAIAIIEAIMDSALDTADFLIMEFVAHMVAFLVDTVSRNIAIAITEVIMVLALDITDFLIMEFVAHMVAFLVDTVSRNIAIAITEVIMVLALDITDFLIMEFVAHMVAFLVDTVSRNIAIAITEVIMVLALDITDFLIMEFVAHMVAFLVDTVSRNIAIAITEVIMVLALDITDFLIMEFVAHMVAFLVDTVSRNIAIAITEVIMVLALDITDFLIMEFVAHTVALSVDTVTVDIAIAITEVIMDSVLDIKDFLIMEFVAHMVVLLVDIAIAITEVIMDSASDIADFYIMEFCSRTRFYRLWSNCYDHYHSVGTCFGRLRRQHLFYRYVGGSSYGGIVGGYGHGRYSYSYYRSHHGFSIRHNRFIYHGVSYQLKCSSSRFYRLWSDCYDDYHSVGDCFGLLRRQHLFYKYVAVQHAIGLNLLRKHSHIANHHVNAINNVANKHVARISHVSKKHERNIANQAGKHVHKIASVANKHINRFKALVDFHIKRLHKHTKQHLSALEYQHKRHLHDREYQNKKHELKVNYLHGKHEHTINKLHDYHGIYGVGHLVSYLDYYKKYHGFKISHNRFLYGGKAYTLKCGLQRFYNLWSNCWSSYHRRSLCFGRLRKSHLFELYSGDYDNDYAPGAVVVKKTVYSGGYHLGDSHVVTYMDYYKKYHGFKISHSRFTYGGKADYDVGYSPKTVVVKTASYDDDLY